MDPEMELHSLPSLSNPYSQTFPGRMIVIEGMDGTGKATQSKLLVERFSNTGRTHSFYSFPDYSSPTGKKVAEYLNQENSTLTPYQRAVLYAEDRKAKQFQIDQDLRQGKVVVCDRYVTSNLAYMTALSPRCSRMELRKNMESLEYRENGMPLAHVTFILDLLPEYAAELVKKKGEREYTTQKQDVHERNLELQNEARAFYLGLANSNPFLYQIVRAWSPLCEGFRMRTPAEIHHDIFTRWNHINSLV